jgi:ribonucleoside-diphosphate reductase alpha chain
MKSNNYEPSQEVIDYFRGDKLASDVFLKKYALKDLNENLLEHHPDEMHDRIAREFARIDRKYPNPKLESEYFESIKNFKYIIPGGSPMAGIGDNMRAVSISNCFVIGNKKGTDSYGGIMKIDEEAIQLMKRRGGVGLTLDDIRPAGLLVHNSAMTSTGVVPFMERFSNTTKEVAQQGRRGAMMQAISIRHPESGDFMDAKMSAGKVTGANISIKFDKEFMDMVASDEKDPIYIQYFPLTRERSEIVPTALPENVELDKIYQGLAPGSCYKLINPKKFWAKLVHNAWASAEPGVLFWDRILEWSSVASYYDEGFAPISTNPCKISLQR